MTQSLFAGTPLIHDSATYNLQPDKKYVTTWNYGGMTNEVMVWMNLIHLGLKSDRVPIIFPLVGSEYHVGVGPETLSAGSIFDLPRLMEAIEHPVLDWQDVKKGRFNRPWHEVDRVSHPDDELLGCWSIVQTFDESKRPLSREGGPHVLHLGEIRTTFSPTREDPRREDPRKKLMRYSLGIATDVQYTAVPPNVKLKGSEGWHTTFDSLSHLLSNEGRSEALTLDPPLPTYGERGLPPTVAFPNPDNQVACFDNLYWVWQKQVWEWETDPCPTWEAVGKHLHFTKEADEIATLYLQKLFGLEVDEEVPSFIAIHARHTDFKNLCRTPNDPDSCYTSLTEYTEHVQDLTAELVRIHGADSPLAKVKEVIMMSDETDPKWWADVEMIGWKQMRSYEDEIARDYGRRWPAIVDTIVQSRSSAFIGTSQSTFSLISAWRVKTWNNGPWKLVEWKRR
ncbi:hypothetical protein FRC05_005492 [Tulasnella sp. 425]|nr:hypothetical protein FRC05_005492 [Tulasnella sp. 425]